MHNTVAYFDMDRTILSDSSGILYMRYLWGRGDTNRWAMLRAYWYAALYKLGLFDYPAIAAKLASTVSENSEAETWAVCQRFVDELAVNYVAEKAAQRMGEHRAQGHLVTIISASTPYVVGPVAKHLSVTDYLCTQLEVVEGQFTGKIVQPPCYGEGKIYWAREYAQRHGADLSQAYFYTDSHSDRTLLEQVGHPVAVNPDPRLKALATRLGWPVEYFY
jgi:putative phosphoserine phosphatase/1-acylglycerol-3-phosphate O-acyltransferase